MAIVSSTLTYRSLQNENVAWKLLHAKHAPYIIAILDEHLGGEVTRRTVAEMNELVDYDLAELGERILEMPLGLSGKEYLEKWRLEGYLIRKPNAETRQETYELSSGALAAIHFVKNLSQPRRTATKSRLGIIFDLISNLSVNVGDDDNLKRETLLKERQRIDEQLIELESGTYATISEAEALEQAAEIIGLAKEIPLDFTYVSSEFERISKTLFTKLIGYEEDSTDTLADIFAGVDHIAQSPEGQSFRGFYQLLQDYEESERLYDSIDIILDADFSHKLSPEQRHYLRHLVRTLLSQSRAVNETMTDLARNLRRFVQSQSFQEDRVLKRLLDKSLALASELTEIDLQHQQLSISLQLTSTHIEPISRQQLRDPSDDSLPPQGDMTLAQERTPLSLEELKEQIREVEIDFDELIANVNDSLGKALTHDEGAVSIGQVLASYPATQGAASIVGLMMLADEQGRRRDDTEQVEWTLNSGVRRMATIEKREFIQEVT